MGHAVRRFAAGTRGRMVLVAVSMLAVVIAVADSVIIISRGMAERAEINEVLASDADLIEAAVEMSGGRPQLRLTDLHPRGHSAMEATLVQDGQVVAQTQQPVLPPDRLVALAAAAPPTPLSLLADVTSPDGEARRALARRLAPERAPATVLVVDRPALLEDDQLLIVLVATLSLSALALGGLMTYWLAGRVLKPVREITNIARTLGEQELGRRIEVEVPPDEMAELVATFNSMLARLEAAFEGLKRFTADASHELRAPLALMRAEIERVLAVDHGAAEYRQALKTSLAEVEHLTGLTDHLLLLARADAGDLIPAREPIDVADLLYEIGSRWQAVAARRGAQIEIVAPRSGTVSADPSLLRRVLDNLIDNALRHTDPDRGIELRARLDPASGWWLEVADHGPGVGAEVRPRLFHRFALADASRTRDAGGGGAGLGLAISAAIAAAHGGRLELIDEPGYGAVFRLTLPPAGGAEHPGSSGEVREAAPGAGGPGSRPAPAV